MHTAYGCHMEAIVHVTLAFSCKSFGPRISVMSLQCLVRVLCLNQSHNLETFGPVLQAEQLSSHNTCKRGSKC